MGCGTQRGLKEYVRGHQEIEIQMLPKIKFEIVVSSEEWEQKTIDAIRKAAYTGNIGVLLLVFGPMKLVTMLFKQNNL